MTHSHRVFRKTLKEDMPQMPPQMSAHIDETLDTFRQTTGRRSAAFRLARAGAVLLLVLFFLLPNVSPAIAYAMQEIPVLGELVSVLTIYKIDEEDERHFQKVDIPQIDTAEGDSPAMDYVNASVEALTNAVIAEYEASMAAYPEAYAGLRIDYEVVTNTSRWFTLKLMVYRTGGSGGMLQFYFYHIDKQRGELVSLPDLFREEFDYRTPISQEIKLQMRQQQTEDPNTIYWDDAQEDMLDSVFQLIAPEQNFYFDEVGDLVIVFDKYEVAPGYMGCPAFTIPAQVYAEGLALTPTEQRTATFYRRWPEFLRQNGIWADLRVCSRTSAMICAVSRF